MVVEWAQRQRSYMSQAMPSETPVMVVASATWAPGEGRAARRSVKAYCRLRAMRGTHLRATRGRHYAKSGADAWQCGGRALSFPAPVSFSSIPQCAERQQLAKARSARGVSCGSSPPSRSKCSTTSYVQGRLRDAVLRGVHVRTQEEAFILLNG